jgi:hypothetical protein
VFTILGWVTFMEKKRRKNKGFYGKKKKKQRKNKGCVKHNYAPVRGLRLFRDFFKIIFLFLNHFSILILIFILKN